jgi:hypothetical protein
MDRRRTRGKNGDRGRSGFDSNALEAIRLSVEGRQRVRRDRRDCRPDGPPKAGRIKLGIRLAMSGRTKGVGSRPLHGTGEVSGRQSLGLLDKVSGINHGRLN